MFVIRERLYPHPVYFDILKTLLEKRKHTRTKDNTVGETKYKRIDDSNVLSFWRFYTYSKKNLKV
jgi:hypothetical protein